VTFRRSLLLVLLPLLAGAPARGQDAPATAPVVSADASPDAALQAAAFAPDRLRARRQALRALLPAKAVVLVSAGPRGDDTFPFRPRPDFLYLSGRREAELSLLLTEDEDVLFAPPKDERHDLWNGARIAPGSPEAAASGFGEVVDWGERTARLTKALAGGGPLFLAGIEPAELGLEKTPAAQGCEPMIARLRQVKDEAELALLERAIGITDAALVEAARSVQPGLFEFEAKATIEYLFLRHGAQRPGFASIVGSGPNSCTLHYQDDRRRMQAGDLVVMDVGAELWGYTADVTRTVPVSGRFTPRQREVYELVRRAQEAGFAAVKPGASLRQVDAAARAVIRDAGYARFFPHGTSHWLGLDVHDVGAYDRPFEPGMVLTVEPGIYLPDEAIGVRIEDDVLVTPTGGLLLSGAAPRTPDELEALMQGRGVGNEAVEPVPPPPTDGGSGPRGRRFFSHQ
jgi:Xaa-Pro aminopeptidase